MRTLYKYRHIVSVILMIFLLPCDSIHGVPTTSTNGSTCASTASPACSLTDGSGNVWSFQAGTNPYGSGPYILKNGVIAAGGAGVLLEYVNTVIWVKNASGSWYNWSGTAWVAQSSGPPAPPPVVNFTLTPSTLIFNSQAVNTVSTELVTLTNSGSTPITFSTIEIYEVVGTAGATDWGIFPSSSGLNQYASGNQWTLQPGASSQFIIIFWPHKTGSITGTVLVQSGGTSLTVSLSGTAQ